VVLLFYVSAASEVEMKRKKTELMMHCVQRAAVEEGIVAGGGVALLRAKKRTKRYKTDNADEEQNTDYISRCWSP
jgi:chaperonin GroEL